MSVNSNVELPTLEGDLVANCVNVNLSGRFKGQELKEVCYSMFRHLVTNRRVNLFFTQQSGFKFARLPDDCETQGNSKAALVYNVKYLQANDETQYRHFMRDLELKGRIPKFYLPEGNYALCKMKSRIIHDVTFIAMSWMTDECNDGLRCLNLLRKVLSFAANLCAVEEMPVIIGGTFRISLDEIKQVVYNEFEGFRCYGYRTSNTKRQARMYGVFISCPPLKLDEVKPIVCGKIESPNLRSPTVTSRWCNPEDVFYWDPMFGKLLLRPGTSAIMSLNSPRAITPPLFEQNIVENNLRSEYTYGSQLSTGSRKHFDNPDATLKMLLAESEKIKELVNEAEQRSRQLLLARDRHANDVTLTSRINGCENQKPSHELAKIPSYVDLYDEELIENNWQCYMQ